MTRPSVLMVDIGATKTLLTVRLIEDLERGWSDDLAVVRALTLADPAELVAWADDHGARLAAQLHAHVAAVGLAAPGPLDSVNGVVTRASNLGWSNVPLTRLFSDRLGVPAGLDDDANTAALGEWRFGAGQGTDPMSYLTVSSGVGGAIVVGGRVIRGASGNAGEVGHLVVDPTGPRCACGRRGDVEAFAGGVAIARRARRAWPGGRLADGQRAPRTAQEVFATARAGDPVARQMADDAVAALATALAAMTAVIEPQAIVVGGSIGLAQRRVVRRAATLARKRVLAENGRSLRVIPAALGEQSVLAGAVDTALRSLARSPRGAG